MSSDSKPPANPTATNAQMYVYPPPLVSGAAAKPSSAGGNNSTLERLWTPDANPSGPPAVTEEQIRAREAHARKEGRDEGLAVGAVEFQKKLAAEKQMLVQTAQDFIRERESYFHRVEAEVVGLAVAIARKILHREAQVDPLLLAGVVRVALDQIESKTKVVVRVHPEQAPDARSYLQRTLDPQSVPEVVDDPTLELDCCVLQTEMGTAELGIEAQLKEIEQGLFDLLAKRPPPGG